MGDLRELWQLRDENRRLKHVVADLTLDKQILREAVGKTWCAQPIGARASFGHTRLHVWIRREGWVINHKKTHRLYKAEGLQLKPKRPRRRRAVLQRAGGTLGLQPPTAYRRAGIFESRSVRTLNLR